jgi:hypothetical protein
LSRDLAKSLTNSSLRRLLEQPRMNHGKVLPT